MQMNENAIGSLISIVIKNGYNSTIGGSGILQPKPVFCIELELSFSSISDAANAIICETGSTLELETVKREFLKL